MACLVAGTGVDGCSHTIRGGSSLSLRSEALFFPKVSVVRMGEAKGLSVKAMVVVPKFKGAQRREKHLIEMIEKKLKSVTTISEMKESERRGRLGKMKNYK